MNIKIELAIQLDLEKRELTLITKALCGKLRSDEVEAAKALGGADLSHYSNELSNKSEAATHAISKASE